MTDDFFSQKQNITAIIRISFGAFKKNLKFVALTGLLIIIPLNLIFLLIPMPPLAEVQDFLLNQGLNINLLDSPEIKKLTGYVYTLFGVAIIFSPLSAGAAAYLAKTHIHSETPNFRGFMDSTITKWVKLAITSLLYNLILGAFIMLISFLLMTGIGSFFSFILIVPAVIYGVGMSFHMIVAATGDKWALSALKESYRVVRPILMPAISFKLIVSVISYIFTVVFSSVIGIVPVNSDGVASVFNFVFGVLSDMLRLFFLILPAVWYYNRDALK